MPSAHDSLAESAANRSELSRLHDSVRVLGEVVAQLAERVELLETREDLRTFRRSGR